MADAVAITSVVTSGIVTPSIVAWYAWRMRDRERDEKRHERRRTLLEEGTGALLVARSGLEDVFALWAENTSRTSEEAQRLDLRRRTDLERVWLTFNTVVIEYGLESGIVETYAMVLERIGALESAVNLFWSSTAKPTPEEKAGAEAALDALIDAYRELIREIRLELDIVEDPPAAVRRGPWVW